MDLLWCAHHNPTSCGTGGEARAGCRGPGGAQGGEKTLGTLHTQERRQSQKGSPPGIRVPGTEVGHKVYFFKKMTECGSGCRGEIGAHDQQSALCHAARNDSGGRLLCPQRKAEPLKAGVSFRDRGKCKDRHGRGPPRGCRRVPVRSSPGGGQLLIW